MSMPPPSGFLPVPLIPSDLGVDPLLAAVIDCAAFLDLADDGAVDAEQASVTLEHVAYYVRQLPSDRVELLGRQLDAIVMHGNRHGWPETLVQFARSFLANCGVPEPATAHFSPPASGSDA